MPRLFLLLPLPGSRCKLLCFGSLFDIVPSISILLIGGLLPRLWRRGRIGAAVEAPPNQTAGAESANAPGMPRKPRPVLPACRLAELRKAMLGCRFL